MARVSNEEIERIKAEISCESLAASAGVSLKPHGRDLIGRCPFHNDKTPSLVITPSKNLWHCLGACQTGGSPIDWVMRAEGVSFRRAVDQLSETSSHLVASTPPSDESAVEQVIETGMEDKELLERVVSFYERTLQESPEALDYLKKRGLNDREMLKIFRLGFANRTLASRLPDKTRNAGAALREQLQQVGIFRKSGHEHFNGSLVVPILDAEGGVAGIYGRKVGDRLRKGTPKHLYLPGSHRGVFNIDALFTSKELVLCESLIDALTFWCAGFRNVTCSYGIEGFTNELKEALEKSGVEKVLIAYDSDEAGDAAALKLALELSLMGIEPWRVVFPSGMDANEYALKVTPAEKSLGTVLRNAKWMGKGSKPGRGDEPQVTTPLLEPPQAESQQATKEEVTASAPALSVIKECSGDVEASLSENPPPSEDVSPQPEKKPASSGQLEPAELGQLSEDGDQFLARLGDRQWRVRGLSRNKHPGVLKVNVLIRRERFGFHVDTLELYSARHRAAFVGQAATETASEARLIKRELGEILMRLEQLQEERLEEPEKTDGPPELTEEQRAEALELLKDPDLLERILADFEKLGVIGERTNKLTAYLAATSRKLEKPLAIVVQSSSAAGKSSLMEAVLALMPRHERVSYSAMTGQSLFYMNENNLSHKILSIAEEEGAEKVAYALKLLQSEGELTIASTGKDPITGRLVTQEYRVEGPVMIFMTTTSVEVDEELLNRCLVLTVDETREQTHAIHALQRLSRTLHGQMLKTERGKLLELHQNAQSLLHPYLVANPYAPELDFADTQIRSRRDNMKFLTLIEAIALLRQYQRPVKEVEHKGQRIKYIEVERQDIELATELSRRVLDSSLEQLPAKTRELLERLETHVSHEAARHGVEAHEVRFTRRELREALQTGDTQLKTHLGRLVEFEYVEMHRDRHSQRHIYQLPPMCDAQPVGGGRGVVGGQDRPVLGKDISTLSEPVGVSKKSLNKAQKNGRTVPHAESHASPLTLTIEKAAAAQ